jgi:hypothetical protein
VIRVIRVICEICGLKETIILYDPTNTYFEGSKKGSKQEDNGISFAPPTPGNRPDCLQQAVSNTIVLVMKVDSSTTMARDIFNFLQIFEIILSIY